MNQHALHLVLHDPAKMDGQARAAITKMLIPYLEASWKRGIEAIALTAEPQEDALTTEQRGYLHIVYQFIADHAVTNGAKFPMPIWKEFFRAKFLGFKVRTYRDPMTGKKLRRSERISTESLGVQGYARLIDLVIAFAATDLVLEVPPPVKPLPKWKRGKAKVDQETGEVMEPA